jgi:arylsulfatase A-like enzyme
MHCRPLLTCAVIAALVQATATAAAAGEPKPNIVILLADDLGYADVGFNGGDLVPTPHIDRIAREGVKLERFYSCPVCSPTRAGLMTGRWPLRMGLMRSVVPPWAKWGLPAAEKTLPELLADAGYARRGIVGKWHLGHATPKHHPLANGFTSFYGHYNGAIDYLTHEREGQTDWHRDRETVREEGYTTDLLAADAVRFIEAGGDKPFFLYVPFNAVHSPYQAKAEDLAKFEDVRPRRRKIYAAMTAALDRAVGNILDALDRRGAAENTFVLFCSDNGGVGGLGDYGPLRGAKASVYEGGIRVAAAARWPAGGVRGGRTVAGPIGYIDVYPTVKRIAGLADAPDPNPLDGVDVLDLLRGQGEPPRRDWFSFISMRDPDEHVSVISGRYKLNAHGPSVLDRSADPTRTLELFDLQNDPRETKNLIESHRDVAGPLLDKLRTFRGWQVEGVGPYNAGRAGFQAPKDWVIR